VKVIITGGSGLIGRALSARLAAAGHEVLILSRSPERVSGLPAGVTVAGWDARSAAGWAQHADGADAIVNLAGASIKGEGFLPSRWSARRKALIRQSRVDAGAAVVEAVRLAKVKPKLVLQASAVGYYGPCGDQLITEDSPPAADFLAEVCKVWEASTAAVEAMGVRRVITRTGLVLTMQGGAFPLLVLPFRLFGGGWFGSGRQYYPWIHFEDYLTALQFLIESGSSRGAYNLSAPQPVTNREFARTLGRVLRRPSWLPAPAFALRAALGEVSAVVLEGQRAVPAHLQAEGFQFKFPDLEPALRDLMTRGI
jgi:uncharacterized protein (TIGR01777 family)